MVPTLLLIGMAGVLLYGGLRILADLLRGRSLVLPDRYGRAPATVVSGKQARLTGLVFVTLLVVPALVGAGMALAQR